MDAIAPYARIAIVLLRPGQPTRDGCAAYLRALLMAQGQRRGMAARALAGMRVRRLLADWANPPSPVLDRSIPAGLEADLWAEGAIGLFSAGLFAGPTMSAVARDVAAWAPDDVVVLPPSPLFSGGLNGLALLQWQTASKAVGLDVPERALCCHPIDPLFLRALVGRAAAALNAADPLGDADLVLVMPSLTAGPQDPLPWQLDRLAGELARLLDRDRSRVRPALLPIPGYGLNGVPDVAAALSATRAPGVALLPLLPTPLIRPDWHSFLPHWRELAVKAGVQGVTLADAAPVQGEDMALLVRQARAGRTGVCSGFGRRLCPTDSQLCPHRRMAVAAMHGVRSA